MREVIVEIFDNDKILEKHEFKSLKDVTRNDRFKGIEYSQLREVYLYSTDQRKPKKKHHMVVQTLIKNIRIYDKFEKP